VFIINEDTEATQTFALHEDNSTNQRGELLGLLAALDFVYSSKEEAFVVTDSEYLYNAMTKNWYSSWFSKGWITALGEPVKNKEIWLQVLHVMNHIEAQGTEINFFHIKGHAVSFGKKTGLGLLYQDLSGKALYNAVATKYMYESDTRKFSTKMQDVLECSVKNHGYEFNPNTARQFICMNIVADFVATREVELADSVK
jgi:ribonuclease HI